MMDVPDYLGIDSTDEERAEQLASLWRFVAPFAPLEVLHAAAAISPDDLTVHEESRGSLKFWTSTRSVFVLDRRGGACSGRCGPAMWNLAAAVSAPTVSWSCRASLRMRRAGLTHRAKV